MTLASTSAPALPGLPPPVATRPKAWAAPVHASELAKLESYDLKRVHHAKLSAVMRELESLLLTPSDSSIIVVVGATGVGKTTLSGELERMCRELYADVLSSDGSAVPSICVEAYTNGDQSHGFKGLYEQMLDAIAHPNASAATGYEEQDGRLVMRAQSKTTIATLRKSVERGLAARKTKLCIVDEAAHLMRFASQAAVMDTLKSLSNSTGAKLLLVGSFDLLDLIVEHGQVARRTVIVSFDRYHLDSPQDRAEFKQVVAKLQRAWPFAQQPNFTNVSDNLLEATLGCVGLLKTFMLDAAALQARNNGKWDMSFLAKAVKSNKLREQIRAEIEAGEMKVRAALVGESLWDQAELERMSTLMGVGNA